MLVEELLRRILDTRVCHDDLMDMFELIASHRRITQLWVDNLIKPVFIIMIFVRAEQEVYWPLNIWTVNIMMPFFFYTGHFNYARFEIMHINNSTPIEMLF